MSRLLLAAVCALGAMTLPGVARAQSPAPRALVVIQHQEEGRTRLLSGEQALAGSALGAEMRQLLGSMALEASATPISVSADALSMEALLEEARAQQAAALIWLRSSSKSDGGLRATALEGQEVALELRLAQVASGSELWKGKVTLFAYGKSEGDARRSGLQRAWSRLRDTARSKLARRFNRGRAPGKELVLELRGIHGFRPASAILQRLAATKGVDALHIASASRGRVRLSLETSLNAQGVAASLRRARIESGSFTVTLRDGRIEVSYDEAIAAGDPNG